MERGPALEGYIREEGRKVEEILIPLIEKVNTSKELLKQLNKNGEIGLIVLLFKAIEGREDLKPAEILKAFETATRAVREEIVTRAQETESLSKLDFETLQKADDVLGALNKALKEVEEKEKQKEGFENVLLGNGMEVMLSRKISEPLTFENAVRWCTDQGGRVPTIEELQALYNKTKENSEEGQILRESFDELVFWSSTFDKSTNSRKVFDFKDGRVEIRSDTEELHVARAVA